MIQLETIRKLAKIKEISKTDIEKEEEI